MDVHYCTNAINYTVALAVLAREPRPAVLLYERRRIAPRRLPIAGVRQWPIGLNALRLVRLLARLRPFERIHVPHHSAASRFQPLLDAAPRLDYLDDGLDTLRRVPRNIDLARLQPGERYHTFTDHDVLPPWLAALDVRRDCALADVLRAARAPRIELAPYDTVFIESPGLDIAALLRGLAVDPARALVVRHPVAHKRALLPPGCAFVDGNSVDLEGSVLACSGKQVCCGETMAFVLLWRAAAAARHRLWLQLAPAQWDNLVGLPQLRTVALPGANGRLAVLASD